MCDIVKTRCRLSVDRKTSKHVNLKTCKPQNIRSIFERLLKNKPQNVRSTFERLLGSKNEENVFVYFVRQKVYERFTKSLSYAVFLSVFFKTNLKPYAVLLSVFLSQSIKNKEDAFVCFARRKVYEKCTKGVRKMPKRIKAL